MTRIPFPEDTPWEALTRYIAGELSTDEAAEVDRWIAADAAHPALVDQLRRLWAEAPSLRREWNTDSALERIKRRQSGPAKVIRLPAFYRAHAPQSWRRATQLGVAAAAAVAIVAAGMTMSRAAPPPRQSDQPAFEVSTTLGQRASAQLSDGSHVMLGPMSSIRYSSERNGSRTVHLTGQALFTVAHDSTRPFTVYTTHGVATDLGTRFVVRNYPGDSAIVVSVVEGKVSLRRSMAATDSVLVEGGDRAMATGAGALAVERGVDVQRDLAWFEGRLEFRYTPMRDVVTELGRWYDVDIRLASNAIASQRLSASFRDESIDEVLRLIAASLAIRVERHGKIVTLK